MSTTRNAKGSARVDEVRKREGFKSDQVRAVVLAKQVPFSTSGVEADP